MECIIEVCIFFLPDIYVYTVHVYSSKTKYAMIMDEEIQHS